LNDVEWSLDRFAASSVQTRYELTKEPDEADAVREILRAFRCVRRMQGDDMSRNVHPTDEQFVFDCFFKLWGPLFSAAATRTIL